MSAAAPPSDAPTPLPTYVVRHGTVRFLGTFLPDPTTVPAVVARGARRVVLRLSAGWPFGEVFGRVLQAVASFAGRLAGGQAGAVAAAALPM